jgi:hypothetical protein
MEDGTGNVFVSCFDDPDKLVEVPVSLLESMNCRLASLIRNTEPSISATGRPYFKAGPVMTRAMLITFVKSSAMGELVPCRGVTVAEAIKVFDYECPNEGGGLPSTVSQPSDGLAFCKRNRGVMEEVTALCERVADALVQWPRLESIMACASPQEFGSEMSSSLSDDSQAMQFTATATRAWIRFADRPKVSVITKCDPVMALATENPRWLSDGLIALGVMHYRMSLAEPEFGKLRDESSCKKLYSHVTTDPLGSFFAVKTDAFKVASDSKSKRELTKGNKFCKEMRNAILNGTPERLYARAAVSLVDYIRVKSPTCSRIFSGGCADESGVSPERAMLKKALKARGVSVIRWTDVRDPQIRPIVFPPSWRDGSNASCYGPSVLLGFENLI